MTDEPDETEETSEEREARERLEAGFSEARKMAAEAAARYAEGAGGGFVTGYVFIFEYVDADGQHDLRWLTGNGSDPSEEDPAAAPSWRVEGMVRWAVRDIIAGNVRSR